MGEEAWGSKIVESLLVKLTPTEALRKSEELARHMQETAAQKLGKTETLKRLTEEIKAREAVESRLAQDILNGTEERPIECFESPRYSELLVDIVRADTHEVVRTRAMQPHERQGGFGFHDIDDDDEREDPNPRAPTTN